MKISELFEDKTFHVPVEYGPTASETQTYKITAKSKAAAKKEALRLFKKSFPSRSPYVPDAAVTVLKEGGNALKAVGVTRINKADVPATIQYLSKLSGIPTSDMNPLGSTGKSSTSGDIDVAINISKYNPQQVHDMMAKKLGADHSSFNKGTHVGSYAVPIAGDVKNGLVQVDFMFVPNTEWAKFSYHSAGDKSKYKGVVRTLLLRSVASILDEKGTDMFAYDPKTNDLMIRIGRTMDMNTGIRRIIQLRPKKKSGEGYLSTMKTVTMDELEAAYPGLDFSGVGKYATIDKPEDALKVMFGFAVKPDDVDSAEQVVQLIKRLPKDKQTKVFQKATENLKVSAKFTDEQIKELFAL